MWQCKIAPKLYILFFYMGSNFNKSIFILGNFHIENWMVWVSWPKGGGVRDEKTSVTSEMQVVACIRRFHGATCPGEPLQSYKLMWTDRPDGHRRSVTSRLTEGPSKGMHCLESCCLLAAMSYMLHTSLPGALFLCIMSCNESCAHLQGSFPLKELTHTTGSAASFHLQPASATSLKQQRFFSHLEGDRA